MDEDSLDVYVLCLSPKASTTVLQVVTQLRAAGYRTDTDYLNRSMKAQFKTVDRMHAKVAIMIGEQDLESGSAAVKNIETKEKTEVSFDSIVEAIDAMFGEAEEEHTCTCGEEHFTCQPAQYAGKHKNRTHTNGKLRLCDAGKEVTLIGWVA
mgnify:CR=1 FL=1